MKLAQQQLKTYRQSVLKWAFEGKLNSENNNLHRLREGWDIKWIKEISARVTVGHVGSMKTEYIEKGIPFLRGQNVKTNKFDSNGMKYISKDFHKSLAKSKLIPGDILVVRSGNIGTSCVVPDYSGDSNCSDLVIIKKSPLANSSNI